MTIARRILLASAMTLPLGAAAAEFKMPAGSELAAQRFDGLSSQKLAIGAFENGEVPSIWAEGNLSMEAWTGALNGRTTLQVLEPLRAQLVEQGYDVLFECRDRECGGFDFRYAQTVLPEPDMHVDLGDFRYLSAQRMGEDGMPEYVALIVSRNSTRDFVQITRLGENVRPELVEAATSTKSDPIAAEELEPLPLLPSAGTDLASELTDRGMAVLNDLSFQAGSAELDSQTYPSLADLSDLLKANPGMHVSLVGHTDTKGSMETNFRLSKARAQSVRKLLIDIYGVSAAQVDAQGVGFLAPLVSNDSEDGRERNRRVEVVLITKG